MNQSKIENRKSKIKFKGYLFFIIIPLLIILGVSEIYAEEKGVNRIKDVRFGIHDGYTRVVFDLEQNTSYKVIPDIKNRLITIRFFDLRLYDGSRSEKFSDSRIKAVYLSELPYRDVRADIILRNKNNLFFYFELRDPPRIVIDIREKDVPAADSRPPTADRLREKLEPTTDSRQLTADRLREKGKPITRKIGKSVDQKKDGAMVTHLSGVKDEERDMYRNCLKLFQEKRYGDAKSGLQSFMDKYQESKFAGDAAFLIGDSYYNIARKTGEYLPAVKAYKSAMRRYQDSDKIDLALYRMGRSYRKMKLITEAKASYEEILDSYPKGKFASRARLNKADILLEEKKFKMAYRELKKIVSLYPFSRIAGDATFKIANSLYKSNDFISAELIYEEANKRWPTYPKAHPEVMFNMGQIYFKNGRLGKARNIFFVLINLYPVSDISRKALMVTGDIYSMEGMEKESLKVYSEAILRGPNSDEAYYGKIRMADMGMEKPDIKVTDIIFDYTPYYSPMDTYKEIAERKPSDLTGEALLKKGIALSKQKRYTEAIQVFRDVVTGYPDTRFSKEGIFSLQKTFYKLVDTYHSQEGFLPVLLAYHKNLEPYLRDITDVESLFQIGESYQKIGLYDAAIDRYRRAMALDLKGVYSDRLVFKTGESYLLQENYTDAERVLKEFFKRFSKSSYLPHARLSLGDTFYRQARFKEAAGEYRTLINTYPKDQKISEIYYYLGNSYKKSNKFDMAIDAYKKSISSFTAATFRGKKAPDYISDSYFEIGDCLYKDKKYPAAIEAFQRAIKLYPEDERYTWALYFIGDSYRRLKKKDNAIAVFSDIVKDFKGELIGEIADRDIKSIKWEEKYKEYF
ncbi:MAG: tetratricopeptide repeat protein [Nitrospinota bacterium]